MVSHMRTRESGQNCLWPHIQRSAASTLTENAGLTAANGNNGNTRPSSEAHRRAFPSRRTTSPSAWRQHLSAARPARMRTVRQRPPEPRALGAASAPPPQPALTLHSSEHFVIHRLERAGGLRQRRHGGRAHGVLLPCSKRSAGRNRAGPPRPVSERRADGSARGSKFRRAVA